jgi:hypothetical protein
MSEDKIIINVSDQMQMTTAQYENIGALDQYTIPSSGFNSSPFHTSTSINPGAMMGAFNTFAPHDQINIDFPKEKKYIVAGNYQEYIYFINKKKFNSDDFVYVNDYKTLIGRKNIHGYYIGSWRSREDIGDIKIAIEMANLE